MLLGLASTVSSCLVDFEDYPVGDDASDAGNGAVPVGGDRGAGGDSEPPIGNPTGGSVGVGGSADSGAAGVVSQGGSARGGAVGTGGKATNGGTPSAGGASGAGDGGVIGSGGSDAPGSGGAGAPGEGGTIANAGSGGASAGETGAAETGGGGSGGGEIYESCKALHAAEPSSPSGAYSIHPPLAQAPFSVYCDMTTSGGGWTLVLNQGPSFDPLTLGQDDGACLTENCVSRAYSTLEVVSGIMLDMKDGNIVDDELQARAIVSDVDQTSVGKTMQQVFTVGPNFFEAEDNQNLELTLFEPETCDTLPGMMKEVLCGTPVLVFADRIWGCPFPDVTYAIGISTTYTEAWGNCAGWPGEPNFGDNWLPDNFRVWVR